jgi:hypothetical protein
MFFEESVSGQREWILESDCVRLGVTKTGAHMAPVSFDLNTGKPMLPYHISPWQGEDTSPLSGMPEAILRGDFFCLPFGRSDVETPGVPNHGRTSAYPWELVDSQTRNGVSKFRIAMGGALGSSRVTREFVLRSGENIVYDLTTIAGLEGSFPLGHHAVLRMPSKENSILVSTGEIVYGMTYPGEFVTAEGGGRQSLAVGAEVFDLKRVASYDRKESLDCSRYPARRGCSDLFQVSTANRREEPAWTAAVNTEEEYLWFSLRNASLLPSTIFWIENHARQSFPWNGRNCSLGLEDVCSYFDSGTVASRRPNAFSDRGIRTCQTFDPQKVFELPYIQGAVRVPRDFKQVRSVTCNRSTAVFTDRNGLTVSTPVRSGFLFGESLED